MSNTIDDLMAAYHLLRRTQEAAADREGRGSLASRLHTKSAKDWLAEDEAILSGQSPETAASRSRASRPPAEDMRLKLPDLIGRLKELQNQTSTTAGSSQQATTVQVTSVETEVTLEYTGLTPVQGLVRRSQNLAETDRYAFEFVDGGTLKITDKWANKSTTIWGDPHVDVSDVEGNRDGEFSDLKSSDTHTTLELQDGTRVTITAPENGVIQAVDITKGDQHLHGLGVGSKQWTVEAGMFGGEVQQGSQATASLPPEGDVVRAGGDGNDWFDTSGRLVWGKTTGPSVIARPDYMLQLTVQQTVTQASLQQVVDRQF